jgi:heme/copper-type cytochrome/quinol oxidase subunit 3
MTFEPVFDASELSEDVFDQQAPIWWGNVGLIAIESTMFAMLVTTYLYLRGNFPSWPPAGTAAPDLGWATANLALLLGSVAPAVWTSRVARIAPRPRVKVAVWVMLLVCGATVVLRAFEFPAFHCWWSDHAYGSIVWTILAMHTGHLLAATLETAVLLVYLERRELDPHHRLDLTLDSFYWYFVVASWVPLYVLLYLVPRMVAR